MYLIISENGFVAEMSEKMFRESTWRDMPNVIKVEPLQCGLECEALKLGKDGLWEEIEEIK